MCVKLDDAACATGRETLCNQQRVGAHPRCNGRRADRSAIEHGMASQQRHLSRLLAMLMPPRAPAGGAMPEPEGMDLWQVPVRS